MAVSTTFLSALSAWSAAPEPRPPHPIRPIRNVSLFSLAKSLLGRMAGAAIAPLTRADVFRNSRRVVAVLEDVFIDLSIENVARAEVNNKLSSKHQDPSSREIPNSKDQIPRKPQITSSK